MAPEKTVDVPLLTEGEQWRSIPGHHNYWVSNYGRVWATRRERVRGGLKTLTKDCFGYLCCNLGRGNLFRVHTLVLLAFVGAPGYAQEALHYNGVRDDNRLENLRWGTRQENMDDFSRHYWERVFNDEP